MSCSKINFGCKPRADGLCASCWSAPSAGTCPALVRMREFYEGRGAAPSPVAAREGLGDRMAQALAKLGITEDRYQEVKARFGLPPTCGCARRKRWLNRVSAWWADRFTRR